MRTAGVDCGPSSFHLDERKPGTAAKYSNVPWRSLTSITPSLRPTLDFNQPSRGTPVATDQMLPAGGHNGLSSPKCYEVRTDDGGYLIRAAYV